MFSSRCATTGLALLASLRLAIAAYTLTLGFPLSPSFILYTTTDPPSLSLWGTSNSKKPLWASHPHIPYLSASSGQDSITGESGNFRIKLVDEDKCKGLNVTTRDYEPYPSAVQSYRVKIGGYLTGCGGRDVPYGLCFWVDKELDDRVTWAAQVHDYSSKSSKLNKVFLNFRSSPDEDFYGLGAQASFASLKNQSIPIFSREQGVGRGDQPTTELQDLVTPFAGGDHYTTYTAIPQYVSTAGTAFYLSEDATGLANFDFTRPDAVTVRYAELELSGQVLRGKDMLDAVGKVTDYTGRMLTLPEWVDKGAILGIQGGVNKAEDIINDAVQYDCPMVALWLQDWTGTHLQSTPTGINISRLWWDWQVDTDLYPNWAVWIRHLMDDYYIRVLSYVNPFLANTSSKPHQPPQNLFKHADQAGYMVRNRTSAHGHDNKTGIISSGPGISAGILDLTNEKAKRWFSDIMLENVWKANVSGFMADFGEYTPVTPSTLFAHLPNGSSPVLYHNRYPKEWAKFHHDLIHSHVDNPSDQLLFHRSASLGSGRYMGLFWAGDQSVSWAANDGIKSLPAIMAHMGMSGYAHSHGDIGGYTTTFAIPKNDTGNNEDDRGRKGNSSGWAAGRSAELLGRWGELAAVSSPVFRTHEGNIPSVNAQFYTNATTYGWFARSARMFASLAPYRRKVLNTECARKGWPLLRLPVVYHPSDAAARNISRSFYLGSELYLAPVLEEGAGSVEVYLPGGKGDSYTHVWSNETYRGGRTVSVDAPFGRPGVFVVGKGSKELDSFLKFVKEEKDTKVRL